MTEPSRRAKWTARSRLGFAHPIANGFSSHLTGASGRSLGHRNGPRSACGHGSGVVSGVSPWKDGGKDFNDPPQIVLTRFSSDPFVVVAPPVRCP
jgi:hypothetical protein